VKAEEFHRFCCETVPLARMKKRIWTTGETFEADVEIAHFGPAELQNPRPIWTICDAAAGELASGQFETKRITTGQLTSLGRILVDLKSIPAPAKLVLSVTLGGTPYGNGWDIWVYPAEVKCEAPADILVTDHLGDEALARLEAGGKVLLLPASGSVKGDKRGKVPPGFTPIFWNTAWTRRQAPHTLGILCDPSHPALAKFPTDRHSNWQWWDLVTKSQIMILNELPPALRPIVQVIDDWFTARRLGLVFEARVAGGKLLICSIDLANSLQDRPVARQMLRSLLDYMAAEDFQPRHELSADAVKGLFREPTMLQKLGAKVIHVDSQASGYEGHRAIDGDPGSIWHSAWEPTVLGHPHEIVIDLGRETSITGFTYLPRQDMSNGRIAEYEFFLSIDGQIWGKPASNGRFPDGTTLHTVRFDRAVSGRFIRLVGLSEARGGPWTSVAELDVIADN
jgi:hypothetical protein